MTTIIPDQLINIFREPLSLDQSFLLYDFLNKLLIEFDGFLGDGLIYKSPEFKKFNSLLALTDITITDKSLQLVRYELQKLYLLERLDPLIESISSNLMLVNIVDKKLAMKVWGRIFEKVVFTYFVNFINTNYLKYSEKEDPKTGDNPLCSILNYKEQRFTKLTLGFSWSSSHRL